MQHRCACRGGSLTHRTMFCRQQGKVSSRDPQFCGFKTIPLFLFLSWKALSRN